RPCLTCSDDKTSGARSRLALIRTPTLGPRLPPAPTRIPDEIGLWPQNSHRTACENKADITFLILALVPFARSVARSQRSTSTVFTSSSRSRPQRGRIHLFTKTAYTSWVETSFRGSSSEV